MSGRRLRWLGFGLLATAGVGLLTLTSMMNSAFAFGEDTALVIGPSGIPIPPQSYVDAVDNLYLDPNGYAAYTPQGLPTPEGLYPVTGVKSLPLDTSASQGVTILNDAIDKQIAAGNDVVVFGYSQSSTIASLEMAQLAASPNPPSPDQLAFMLVGDPSNPDGGLLERFDGLSLPSLGTTFSGATPADTIYPTDIYTAEYDGFADFPRYPLDLLSDVNALLGIGYEHLTYADLTPNQISGAIPLPVTPDYYADGGVTHYYMIPAENLPLLDPLRLVPVVGNPLADLLQPDMTVLVNLGYGSITQGWDPGPANVPTPFGLFPTNINPADVLTALVNGAGQGATAAIKDLQSPSLLDLSSLQGIFDAAYTFGLTPSDHPTLLEVVSALSTFANGDVPVSSSTNLVSDLTSVASTAYATLLPTADIALALGVTLPEYDVQYVIDGLLAGNPLNAIGDPIALDVGVVPLAVGFEAVVLAEAAATAVSELAAFIPSFIP